MGEIEIRYDPSNGILETTIDVICNSGITLIIIYLFTVVMLHQGGTTKLAPISSGGVGVTIYANGGNPIPLLYGTGDICCQYIRLNFFEIS